MSSLAPATSLALSSSDLAMRKGADPQWTALALDAALDVLPGVDLLDASSSDDAVWGDDPGNYVGDEGGDDY